MPVPEGPCREVRVRLVDRALEGPAGGDPPPLDAEHLRACGACGRYAAGLRAAAAARASGPLYTPALRRRTLAALAAAGERDPRALAPLLLPAAAASLAASFAVPVWITSRLLSPLLPSAWMSLGLAVVVCTSSGLAAVGPGLLALLRLRGGAPDPPRGGGRFPGGVA